MRNLQIAHVSHAFGNRDVLQDVSLSLRRGSKTALTGDNGSGKTTLLKIVAGLMKPDAGEIIAPKGSVLAYLPQSGVVHTGSSLREESESAFGRFEKLIEEKRGIEEYLARSKEGDSGLDVYLERHHEIEQTLLDGGYFRREEQIHRVLTGIGFAESDFTRITDEFSGGWQMRIALAKVLLEQPDGLLLDEPTNYLDLEARDWLEDFLHSYPGIVIVVSHDRYFLDATVDTVAELWNGKINSYRGNFSQYEKKRAVELETIVAAYQKQQDEIAKTEDFIRRFRYNASKAALVQSRITKLEKMEIIEIPESLKRIHFSFPKAPHSGNQVLKVNGVSRSYGGETALANVSFELTRGEKLVIMGANGAGKSTLMRILAGKDGGFSGTVGYGAGVSQGYFSQENDELSEHATVYEEVEKSSPTELIPKLRNILGAFLFRGDDIYKRVSVLSGGERSRLALLKLLLNPANLLVLDEPTNHLDMASTRVLMEALQRFDGTVVFVSHDRHFIIGIATRVLELNRGVARNFPGDFEYYIRRKENDEAGGPSGPVNKTSPGVSHGEHKEQKKIRTLLKRLERDEQAIMEKLDQLEAHRRALMREMAEPDAYTNGERIKSLKTRLAEVEREQNGLTADWNRLEAERKGLPEPIID
ncbi:MAG: ABC-F family ATP-binding cassette domain-containing protein [Spirochaetales bacterium]|nr:ABC-F family ATP-binding cassette domain-containing protein [Spirochaetales bacterium]